MQASLINKIIFLMILLLRKKKGLDVDEKCLFIKHQLLFLIITLNHITIGAERNHDYLSKAYGTIMIDKARDRLFIFQY